MNKFEQAKDILKQLGYPKELGFTGKGFKASIYSLLALADISPDKEWSETSREWKGIHEILQWTGDYYQKYAENSRENFRKDAVHKFVMAAFAEGNGEATNSKNMRYRLTPEFAALLKTYGTDQWEQAKIEFRQNQPSLIESYNRKRSFDMIPVQINGESFQLSTGAHNQLQKAILEEFAPRFVPGAICLYVGDTTDKDLYMDTEKLAELGFEINTHNKMPDVVLYSDEKDWLFFAEAVTSVGPISPKRMIEIEEMTRNVKAGKIYVTAFLDFSTFKKFAHELAWDSEVWIADVPDHMIHLNGNKLLMPRND